MCRGGPHHFRFPCPVVNDLPFWDSSLAAICLVDVNFSAAAFVRLFAVRTSVLLLGMLASLLSQAFCAAFWCGDYAKRGLRDMGPVS